MVNWMGSGIGMEWKQACPLAIWAVLMDWWKGSGLTMEGKNGSESGEVVRNDRLKCDMRAFD
jgi:hypothetical protein